MKFAISLAAIVAVTSAFPLVTRDDNLTRTELEAGSASACPKAILIYARGSIQEGNMVSFSLSSSMERHESLLAAIYRELFYFLLE